MENQSRYNINIIYAAHPSMEPRYLTRFFFVYLSKIPVLYRHSNGSCTLMIRRSVMNGVPHHKSKPSQTSSEKWCGTLTKLKRPDIFQKQAIY